MNPNISSENAIQKNTIALLRGMGYTFISQDKNSTLRNNKLNEVILKDILSEQLQKINGFEYRGVTYKFSSKNIAKAIEELNVPLNEGLLTANQKISNKLVLGTSFEEEPASNIKKSFSLYYIDFNNPENNVFHLTEEFAVERQIKTDREKTRRPDLVLFINGIPFAVIELKKSSVAAIQGVSQMIRNQGTDEIPELFKYVQITLAGNNHSPLYATTGTEDKFYGAWKEDLNPNLETLIQHRSISPLDNTVYALFNKSRVLELLRSYIIFDNKVKKIARYHQYFAVKKTVKTINQLDNTGRRGGGLIWHTQGSGKSLTMVMLAKVIARDIPKSKIILVTDRKDLDRQIHTTFENSEIRAGRASSGSDLIDKLKSGISVITTLIHKFETVKKAKVTSGDPNIFLMVDEAHRTQSDDLHRAMKKVFTHGCYIGFTGTPLLTREKSSIAKFGGLLDQYTIDQALGDNAVLPLLYEGRLVDQWINDKAGMDREFNRITKQLNDEQTADIKRKWARLNKVASNEKRLYIIVENITAHFKYHFQGTGFKAMLATSSKYEAVKYHSIFEEAGEIKTEFVISAADTREGNKEVDEDNNSDVINAWNKIIKNYGSEDLYLEKVKDEFINGNELELLIVVDKLLTGFDAPRATVLYIDKTLQEHGLLQAIARVNRLYTGKRHGYIIDYRGLLENLDKALTSYSSLSGFDENDIVNAVIDIKKEIAKAKTFYSYLEGHFAAVENKQDQESYEVFLADEEKRKEFYKLLSSYANALKIALSSYKIDDIFTEAEIKNYKQKMKFYYELRESVKIRYHEAVDFGEYEKQMQKLIDTYISVKEEVKPITKLVNIFDDGFESELTRITGNNAKADKILYAITKTITEQREQNPAYYDNLSKRIEQIIEEYKEGRFTDEEKLKHAQDIRDILMKSHDDDDGKYPEAIKASYSARAFYDNIYALMQELSTDEFIAIVLKIDDIFKEVSKKPDWENNSDVKNNIDQKIDDILWQVEEEHGLVFKDSDDILEKARSIGISNYAKK